jgi:Cd2+/Zn2+-exporting ATPase
VLLFGRDFNFWFREALTLLVIACPCALVISTPISIYAAIGNASSLGVLIKGGKYIEALGQIKAVAMDKTRTLTYGKPKVTDVLPFGDATREHLLACAAGIESYSEHPLAQAIVDAARGENITFHEANSFEAVLGKGAKAECVVCYDSHHCVGKLAFITEEHEVQDEIVALVEALQAQGKTSIVIGITEVRAELLPEDKATAIRDLLQKYGAVAMVGDGVNDAPALALSSVGIAMGAAGSDTAIEAASIAILNDRLELIPYLIRLGRRTIATIKINTALAVATKLFFIGLAIAGLSSLALAIFADVGVTVIVILNSLRLLRFTITVSVSRSEINFLSRIHLR